MTFVFPILLGGLALAGIPVLLHLIVRQKPKQLPFPAFRFLVQQRRVNTRKLRLRHLLLLALRVLLIAAMCLVLARPRLFHRVLGLDGERPVMAVLLFDTSASMEYRSSDGQTRLDEARQRARELLDELPAGSQVAVIDSADTRFDQTPEWVSMTEARQRIAGLKLRPANVPVTQALVKALACAERGGTDQSGPRRLRVLAVLSDRTRGSWDAGQVPAVVEKLDRIPPAYEGLVEARGQVGTLRDRLGELRDKLPPPPGTDYGEKSLIEALAAMQAELSGLSPEPDRWPAALAPAVRQVRRLSRDLLAQLPEAASGEPAQAYRDRLREALAEMLRSTAGVQMLFIDVGMVAPVHLALVQLELPRTSEGTEQQVFGEGDPFTLQAIVQATGKRAPVAIACQVGDIRQEVPIELPADQPRVVPFEIGRAPLVLQVGDNPIEVRLVTAREPVPLSHRRYATVQVRPRQKVLVLVDDPERQGRFAPALDALGYRPEVRAVRGRAKDGLSGFAAIYLLGVAAPDEALWNALADYVKSGGSLGIVPPGDDLSLKAYNDAAARKLMPGAVDGRIEGTPYVGSPWDWDPASAKYAHSFMKRFRAWKDNPRTDFMVLPRGARAYWGVTPRPGEALVLVRYADKDRRPAVLERLFDAKSAVRGKVLLLTTPLDTRGPAWNDYAEDVTSFYVALLSQATGYLAGEVAPPQLNFTLGRGDPVVRLPSVPALVGPPTLRGPDVLKTLALEPGETQITLRELSAPGNYFIEGKAKESGELRRLAGFSLNVPPEETDLTRVPAAEIEPLFAGNALVTLHRQESLHQALQAYRNEPLDLVPYVMFGLLLALALENLLANRFYRKADAV